MIRVPGCSNGFSLKGEPQCFVACVRLHRLEAFLSRHAFRRGGSLTIVVQEWRTEHRDGIPRLASSVS